MAPNGGPSMTSQARAAELNAAAAARARILNGELSDFSNTPSSQAISLTDPKRTHSSLEGPRNTPSQFSSSHTNNTDHVAVESFRRPNRPVDRYYPATSAPVAVYAYPQSQYADPRAIPTVYAPTHYPVATEYFQSVYQPMQSYPQVYPSYMNGYPSPASPLYRGAIATATRPNDPRSPASPTKSGPPEAIQLPATPVKAQRGPSPMKTVPKGPSRSPSKGPVKILIATPSPRKPPVEVLQYFTPDDLSPPKVEVEIMRFKAAREKIAKDEEKAKNNAADKTSPAKSPARSVNEHEGDNGHHKGRDLEVEDEQLTPRGKQSGGPFSVVRTSNLNDQSAMEAPPEARRQPPTLENSPLTQKAYRKSMAEMVPPFSFLPPDFISRSDVKDNLSTANQQQTFRTKEAHSTKLDKSMSKDDGLFYVAQTTDEAVGEISETTPKPTPRRLQSPFRLRPRSPVAYYKPIVNKYPRHVFTSRQSRLEELCEVETENFWVTCRQKPRVKDLPGPFKGFPRFPLVDENAQRPMNTGVLMPPPGFAVPGPILFSRSAHWNSESGPNNRATTYYDRVLAAEDWFHQSNLKKKESPNEFQKKLTEVQSIIFNGKDTPYDLPPSSDLKAVQVTEMIKRVSETLFSYTDTGETEKRGFGFGSIEFELDVGTGLRRLKRNRRKDRRSRRGRNRGVEFDIAPGSELADSSDS